jgi:methionine-rich copper-binding protein CopC
MTTKALLLALGATVLVTNAHAHPRATSTTPAANETVASSPTALRIEFSEPPVAKFSGIELLDARNRAIAIGPSEVLANNRKVLVAPITSKLDPGDYTVVWHAVAQDTHRVEGRYTFRIKP